MTILPFLARSWLATLLLLAIPTAPASAAPAPTTSNVHNISTPSTTVGVTANLEAPTDIPLIKGYMPLRLTIENKSGKAVEWQLNASASSGYSSYSDDSPKKQVVSAELTVPPNNTRRVEIYVPIAPPGTSYGGGSDYVHLRGQVGGTGTKSTSNSVLAFQLAADRSDYFDNVSVARLIVSTRPLTLPEYNAKSAHGSGTKGTSRHIQLKPADLPLAWQGYTSYDAAYIWINDWKDCMDHTQRQALLDWVAHGGRVIVEDAKSMDDLVAIGFPRSMGVNAGAQIVGAGEVRTGTQDPARIGVLPSPLETAPTDMSDATSYDGMRLDALFIVGFLIVFAIVVGPVNLFLLARGRNRWRIFVTTPVISMLATVFLVIFMLIKDGIGAEGVRCRIAYLSPEGHRLHIDQVQAIKTGIIIGGSFENDAAPAVDRLELRKVSTSYGSVSREPEMALETRDNTRFSGDYVRSRSTIWHSVRVSKGTTGVIEFAGLDDRGRPLIKSSLDARIEDAIYIDATGQHWRVRGLHLGSKVAAEKIPPSEAKKQYEALGKAVPAKLRDQLPDSVERLARGTLVGSAENLVDDPTATFDGIEWKATRTLLVTTVSEAKPARAAAAPATPKSN